MLRSLQTKREHQVRNIPILQPLMAHPAMQLLLLANHLVLEVRVIRSGFYRFSFTPLFASAFTTSSRNVTDSRSELFLIVTSKSVFCSVTRME